MRRAFPQTPSRTPGGIIGLCVVVFGLLVLAAVILTTDSKQPISHRKSGTSRKVQKTIPKAPDSVVDPGQRIARASDRLDSPPSVLIKVEPEYSEEALKAKWQGTVVLSLIVDDNGRPQEIKVVRALGLGLDQKAIEAVQKWEFKPGMKDGHALPVQATIEVNFTLQ
jgi:TonB family protein